MQLKASDTDMIVICLSLITEIEAKNIWAEYGTSKSLRLLPIHKIQASLDSTRWRFLPFFLSLTECVTTIAFVCFRKMRKWKVWGDFINEFTEFFVKLSFSISIEKLTESDIQMMECFASSLHLRLKTFNTLEIDEVR